MFVRYNILQSHDVELCCHNDVSMTMYVLCCREEKKCFIRAKYEGRRFAITMCSSVEDRKHELKQAVLMRDLPTLLQLHAEGIDFTDALPQMVRMSTNQNT